MAACQQYHAYRTTIVQKCATCSLSKLTCEDFKRFLRFNVCARSSCARFLLADFDITFLFNECLQQLSAINF
jgi:hypothetical protein